MVLTHQVNAIRPDQGHCRPREDEKIYMRILPDEHEGETAYKYGPTEVGTREPKLILHEYACSQILTLYPLPPRFDVDSV